MSVANSGALLESSAQIGVVDHRRDAGDAGGEGGDLVAGFAVRDGVRLPAAELKSYLTTTLWPW